jgi:Uncharacterized conserved protein
MFRALRNSLIAGTFIVLPITVTLMLVVWLIKTIGAPVADLVFLPIVKNIDISFWHTDIAKGLLNLFAALIVVALIAFIGFFSHFFFGRIAISVSEALIGKIPFANTIYKTVKQIVDTFSKQNKAVFQKPVLVEFPRKGVYTIGFLTGEVKCEVKSKTRADHVNVFVPTTPNPTSGFLLILSREEIRELDMTVAEGMKLLVSFGAVVPEDCCETCAAQIENSKD